jgi:Cu2+-exporting ATPase
MSMNCCGSGLAAEFSRNTGDLSQVALDEEMTRAGRELPDATAEYVLNVPGIHCGACISTIERGLAKVPGVVSSRVNLTLRRVTIRLDSAQRAPGYLINEMERLGYKAIPFESISQAEAEMKSQSSELLRALGVAGFAAGNIMLLSVSVWSGAEGATRDLFHLVSAVIALPAVAYCGRPFFRSAWNALRTRNLNMDVPISLGVILAVTMSIYETFTSGPEAYFDAAVTLLFFLLAGRYLDQLMREKARSAVTGLTRLAAKGAIAVSDDGTLRYVPVDEVKPGDRLRVAAGERVPVDGRIVAGATDLDRSLVTGESAPVPAVEGQEVEAGTLSLTGAFDMVALRGAGQSFLAEVMRMMEAAERGRGRYVRIADRLSRMYAPIVHVLAALAFGSWMIATGDWHASIYTAIAVLIITCPCALGLAVPAVHVIGAGRLFELGILMRDGSALERLAEVDRVVFDKTGTLTSGIPFIEVPKLTPLEAGVAKTLASHSVHPASKAVAAALAGSGGKPVTDIREVPGHGVEGISGGKRVRLGRSAWVGEIATASSANAGTGLAFAIEGEPKRRFLLSETLREDAREAVHVLQTGGLAPEILSGDSPIAVRTVALLLGVPSFTAEATPQEKIDHLEELADEDHKVLMVGDGLNDAPALAAGYVSMAPANSSDAGRQAADFVFTRESLMAVSQAHAIALEAQKLVRQNFGLAIAYNILLVPVAFAGMVTPLIAAVAMSASSILVIANSMRLASRRQRKLRREQTVGKNRQNVEAMA